MPDAVELVKTVKKASIDAMESTKPVNICFGTVIQTNPVKINVEQKMILNEAQMIFSRNVTDYVIQVSMAWETEEYAGKPAGKTKGETKPGGEPEHTHMFETETEGGEAHTHGLTGTKEITIHNGLAVGDEVILVRQQGGQKYLVWDRAAS
ncbi:MAG: DUF2577 domain-containing protein [Lachnospiraceae bacterium]|nr:DUF2577 domain-containing protein [Lachnospiraceae bacterium]